MTGVRSAKRSERGASGNRPRDPFDKVADIVPDDELLGRFLKLWSVCSSTNIAFDDITADTNPVISETKTLRVREMCVCVWRREGDTGHDDKAPTVMRKLLRAEPVPNRPPTCD